MAMWSNQKWSQATTDFKFWAKAPAEDWVCLRTDNEVREDVACWFIYTCATMNDYFGILLLRKQGFPSPLISVPN